MSEIVNSREALTQKLVFSEAVNQVGTRLVVGGGGSKETRKEVLHDPGRGGCFEQGAAVPS